jgi:hypothetical protein
VIGSANYPLGKIELHVCFGDHHNFRWEKWNSKSWIGHHNIMFSWGVQHSHDSYSPSLCLSCAKNTRTQQGHYSKRKLWSFRHMWQRIPSDGANIRYDSKIRKTQGQYWS